MVGKRNADSGYHNHRNHQRAKDGESELLERGAVLREYAEDTVAQCGQQVIEYRWVHIKLLLRRTDYRLCLSLAAAFNSLPRSQRCCASACTCKSIEDVSARLVS